MNNEKVCDQLNRANVAPSGAKPVGATPGARAMSGAKQALTQGPGSPPAPGEQQGSGQPLGSQRPLPPLVSGSGNPNPPNYNPRADEG